MTPATLLAWRERLGFNRSKAALALGLSRGAYANYEEGRTRIPRYIALACAAVAYGLPPLGGAEQGQDYGVRGRASFPAE